MIKENLSDSGAIAISSIPFAQTLVVWQKQHGRHSLPWQNTRNAYRIWLSEIMLQQTQVATVIPYYLRFLERFPDVYALANAEQEEVMSYWSGLGYYSRARNLHRCAQIVVDEYKGIFPSDPVLLEDLPGIGQSTAAAIAVFSSGVRAAILDGNVVRVFSRVFGIAEQPGDKKAKEKLWQLAYELLPESDLEAYTQGLMDLGATVCVRSRPDCSICPFSTSCVALAENRIDELPAKKTKKVSPTRKTVMLVLLFDGKVLLEKRPGTGIWGGLLSLPECELPEDASNEEIGDVSWLKSIASSFGQTSSFQFLEPFTHVFSHFRLQITPCLIGLDSRQLRAEEEKYVWYDMNRLDDAPLPAPVRKLLNDSLRQQVLKLID